MSKETFYFSHDYNTRTDVKIKRLIRKHGMTGYGIFWAIVEDLYNNANALQTDFDGIAYDLRIDNEIVKSIINDFDLFGIEDGYFSSKSVERRLDERNEKSKKAKESAFKRWHRDKRECQLLNSDAKAMQSESQGNTIKESIEKNIKEKETKQDNIVPFEDFWNLYEKDEDRIKCEVKWIQLSNEERECCILKLPEYIRSTPNKQFRKNPINYLINKSWNNEIISPSNSISNNEVFQELDEIDKKLGIK